LLIRCTPSLRTDWSDGYFRTCDKQTSAQKRVADATDVNAASFGSAPRQATACL